MQRNNVAKRVDAEFNQLKFYYSQLMQK